MEHSTAASLRPDAQRFTFVPVATDPPTMVLGCYTIAPGALDFSGVPDAAKHRLGRYEVPVFRLGRLAVSLNGQGLPDHGSRNRLRFRIRAG